MNAVGRLSPHAWFSWILGCAGVFLALLGVHRSDKLYSDTGAVDFRNRVVAARQAELGLNPYTFKWNPGFPEALLDPSEERDAKYTRMTSPPTVLWVHSLFADLPWPVQKRGNFILSWLAFFLIPVSLFSALRKKSENRIALGGALIFGTGVMAISGIWQFHLERAQQYAFLTLFLALAVFASTPTSRIFSGWAGALRPTLGFTLFLSFREKRVFRSILIVSALGFLFLLPALLKYPLSWWLDYFAASRDWYLHHHGMHERIAPSLIFDYPSAPEKDATLSVATGFSAPGNIFYHYLMKLGLPPLPYPAGMLLVAVASAAAGWKLWKNRFEDTEEFAFRFFSAVYAVDLLLPSPRSAYNGVFFFPVLLLSLDAVLKRGRPKRNLIPPFIVLLGAAISMNSLSSPLSVPHLVETCYFAAAIGFLFRKARSAPSTLAG